MARLEELKLTHRLFMKAYRYRSLDWRPGARLSGPLPLTGPFEEVIAASVRSRRA
jgi:hypothetical protein